MWRDRTGGSGSSDVLRHQGKEALHHGEALDLQGLIVVKSDSPYRSIAELEGKNLAFPAPAAFAALLIGRIPQRRPRLGPPGHGQFASEKG